jgi:hypothetical protein
MYIKGLAVRALITEATDIAHEVYVGTSSTARQSYRWLGGFCRRGN